MIIDSSNNDVYVCVNTYIYIYIHIPTYMYVCMYIYIYTHVYIYIYMHTHIDCVYTYIYIYIHTYTCVYIYIYIYRYVYMYILYVNKGEFSPRSPAGAGGRPGHRGLPNIRAILDVPKPKYGGAPYRGFFHLLKGLIFFTKPLILGIGASKVLPKTHPILVGISLLLLPLLL